MEKKILIVDDDVLVREVFNLSLKYSGYFVFLADNWYQAIEILEREKLDILLTDFRMPPIGGINNGIELIRFVKLNRMNSHNAQMKIILMSAEMNDSIKSVALAAGADKIVNKLDMCLENQFKELLKFN